MEDKVIAVIGTDIHLKESNIEDVEKVFLKIKEVSDLNKCPVILMGDLVDSRKAHTEKILLTLKRLLTSLREVILIPGNHDKVDYFSPNSILDVFESERIKVVREYGSLSYDWDNIHFLPYFSEKGEEYYKRLEEIKKIVLSKLEIKHYLFTHIGVSGFLNNSAKESANSIPLFEFNLFERVFVGHYHDKAKLENIEYIGASLQHGFSENLIKGIYVIKTNPFVLKEGIQLKFIPINTRKYQTLEIEINEIFDYQTNLITFQEALQKYAFVRLKFIGPKALIKKIPLTNLKSMGFDIKVKYVDSLVQGIELQNLKYSENSLFNEFKNFVKLKGIKEEEIGKKHITQIING